MNLLILGGTRFVGRHLAESALRRGHTVTLFNRGQSNAALFPEAEHLKGDRDGNLSALDGRGWDAVIDTCGYVPRVVRASAEILARTTPFYAFISTISVYADPVLPDTDESAPLKTMADDTVEEITGETYGPLKVLCEQVVQSLYPDNALIIRPGLIIGPEDYTDRFTYWPVRVASGGDVLVPDALDSTIQVIDSRDLADFTITLVEARQTGIYNAVGPDYPLTWGKLLETCQQASGGKANIVAAPPEFLAEHDVHPWADLPLWLPADAQGISQISNARALQAGLTMRPLIDTVRDILAWHATRPAEYQLAAGMSLEKEKAVLAAWQQQT